MCLSLVTLSSSLVKVVKITRLFILEWSGIQLHICSTSNPFIVGFIPSLLIVY